MKKKKVSKKSKPAAKKRKTVRTKVSRGKTKSSRPPKKKAASKRAAKSAKEAPRPQVIAPPNSVLLGRVEDYFAHIGVIALTLQHALSAGQRIQILGHTTNFEQGVESMQIDHAPIRQADAKASVGIKVGQRSRKGDHVFLLL